MMGYSFHFCLFEDAALTEHHSVIEWELFFDVLHRLGFQAQHFQAHLTSKREKPPTPAEFKKLNKDTWHAVCSSIDRGLPAIAWTPT